VNKNIINEISRIKTLMNVVSEQVVTDYDSVWDYKKEGDNYFTKKKTSDSWVKLTGNSLESVKTKVFNNSSSQSTQTSSTNVNVPFKNRQEGDRFRKWVNDTHPEYAKQINLDPSGSYNNSYIKKAWNKYGREYASNYAQNLSQNMFNTNVVVSDTLNPDFVSQINFSDLSSQDTSRNFCTPNDDRCAQFVNDLRDDIAPGNVGNAWTAYRNDTILGPTVYSAFKGLDENTKQDVIDLWLKIHKRGGGVLKGPDNDNVRNIVDRLVPAKGKFPNLKVNDIVGIFHYPSFHHEEAFYEGGIKWFKDENGKKVPGNTIQRGDGWGMNTHLGTVGAIKDGVPLIFHNVGGTALSDPPSNLRIAWIKRKGGGTQEVKSSEESFWDRLKSLMSNYEKPKY